MSWSAAAWFVVKLVVAYAISYALRPEPPDIEGPRLEDTRVQSSAYGRPMITVYGSDRVAGGLIWAEGIKEHKHEEEVGGKGGGGTEKTTYTYTCSFAIDICAGEIAGVDRIWADGKLLYSQKDFKSIWAFFSSRQTISPELVIYTGTETQESDSAIEAVEGSGNVPAHRGRAYAVFTDLELGNYANRIPNLEFEVIESGSEEYIYFDVQNAVEYPNDVLTYAFTICKTTEGSAGFSFAAEPSAIWSTSADIGSISGMPGSFTNFIDLPTHGNSHPSITRDPVDGALWVWLSPSDNNILYKALPGSFTWIEEIELENRTLPELRVSNDGVYLISSGDDRYVPGALDSDIDVHYKYYIFHEYPLGESVPVDLEKSLYKTLSFSGISYTAEGDTINIGDNTDIHTVGMLANYDIVAFVSDANGQSLFITDGISTTIKTAYGYRRSPEGYDWKSGFLDGEDVYLCIDSIIYYCKPLSPIVRTKLNPDAIGRSVQGIVTDIFERAGLTASQYDVSELSSDTVIGYTQSNVAPAEEILKPLMRAFQFDIVEQDWTVVCKKRGSAVVKNILWDDLSAHEAGSDQPEPLIEQITDETEMPLELVLQYKDYDADYQSAVEIAKRSTSTVNTTNKKKLQYPIVMQATTALQAVETLFETTWVQRKSYKLKCPVDYIKLAPGDVFTVANTYKLLIDKVTVSFPLILEIDALAEDSATYTSSSTGTSPHVTPQTLPTIAPVFPIFLDIPSLQSWKTDPGFYLAVYALETGWTSSLVHRSTDNGQTWQIVDMVENMSTIGRTTDALADGPVTVVDEDSTVNVELRSYNKSLSGTTELSMFSGTNTAAIGADDRWEIIGFSGVNEESDGTFTLYDLVRGRRGTDHNTGNHVANDYFVLLETNKTLWLSIPESQIDSSIKYKVVPISKSVQSANAITFTCEGLALYPLSPVHITGSRDGSDNLTIEWIRRSRSDVGWNQSGVPLIEETEKYEIDIYDGATIVRTITVTGSTSTTYSAADQTTDFGSAQSSITLKIYMISATVGRGFGRQVTI